MCVVETHISAVQAASPVDEPHVNCRVGKNNNLYLHQDVCHEDTHRCVVEVALPVSFTHHEQESSVLGGQQRESFHSRRQRPPPARLCRRWPSSEAGCQSVILAHDTTSHLPPGTQLVWTTTTTGPFRPRSSDTPQRSPTEGVPCTLCRPAAHTPAGLGHACAGQGLQPVHLTVDGDALAWGHGQVLGGAVALAEAALDAPAWDGQPGGRWMDCVCVCVERLAQQGTRCAVRAMEATCRSTLRTGEASGTVMRWLGHVRGCKHAAAA